MADPDLSGLVERLDAAPLITLPDMEPRQAVKLAAVIRQMMIDRFDAAAALRSLAAERDELKRERDEARALVVDVRNKLNAEYDNSAVLRVEISRLKGKVEEAGKIIGDLFAKAAHLDDDAAWSMDGLRAWSNARAFLATLPNKETAR